MISMINLHEYNINMPFGLKESADNDRLNTFESWLQETK